jgi:hypothetical protein
LSSVYLGNPYTIVDTSEVFTVGGGSIFALSWCNVPFNAGGIDIKPEVPVDVKPQVACVRVLPTPTPEEMLTMIGQPGVPMSWEEGALVMSENMRRANMSLGRRLNKAERPAEKYPPPSKLIKKAVSIYPRNKSFRLSPSGPNNVDHPHFSAPLQFLCTCTNFSSTLIVMSDNRYLCYLSYI